MGKETIGIRECAKRLGVTENHLRMGIQQGMYPFGVAVRSKGGRRCKYEVYKGRLESWLKEST